MSKILPILTFVYEQDLPLPKDVFLTEVGPLLGGSRAWSDFLTTGNYTELITRLDRISTALRYNLEDTWNEVEFGPEPKTLEDFQNLDLRMNGNGED